MEDEIFPEISVIGPGWLRIDLMGIHLELRNGELWSRRSVWDVPNVCQPFSALEQWFRAKMTAKQNLSTKIFSEILESDGKVVWPDWFSGIDKIWAFILQAVIDRRHGATFIILPEEDTASPPLLKHGPRPGDLSLREFILACESACLAVIDGDQNDTNNKVNRWIYTRHRLMTAIDTITGFANLDGGVILNHELTPISFGTKLSQGDKLLPLVDFNDQSKSMEEPMKKLGTRNNSACRFCQSVPGAIAFVISQDGDLRVYLSTKTHAFAFDRLTP